MEKIEIKTEEVGEEYLVELDKVINIRKERRKIYGDSFLLSSESSLRTIVEGKLSRMNYINKDTFSEKWKDEVRDVINYLLFILALNTKKENNNSK
jgi:hypothetical protein